MNDIISTYSIADSCVSDSSSEDEDNIQVEIADKKLVLDLTVQNEAFQTDESIRQSLNSFVEVLTRDINGQQIRTGDDVTAVLRLTESRKYMLYIDDIYAERVWSSPAQACKNILFGIIHVRHSIVFTNSIK